MYVVIKQFSEFGIEQRYFIGYSANKQLNMECLYNFIKMWNFILYLRVKGNCVKQANYTFFIQERIRGLIKKWQKFFDFLNKF